MNVKYWLRRMIATGAVALLAVSMAACGSGSSSGAAGTTSDGSGSPAAASGKQTVIVDEQVSTLDPVLADQVQNDNLDNVLYDSLLEYDTSAKLVPRLATSWKVNSTATSVVLTLRTDVKFQDGTPLTAADVVYTLDRDKTVGLGVASLISAYKSSVATDPGHVTITLSRPDALFLGALSKIYVLNSAVVKQHAGADHAQAWLAANAAGSGAYSMTSFQQNSLAKMAVNTKYWAPVAGRPAELVVQTSKSSATSRDSLTAGSTDIASLTADDTKTMSTEQFTSETVPGQLQTYVFFNTQSKKLSDVRVREAISLAYDYAGHVSQILSGAGVVANGILPNAVSCRVAGAPSAQDLTKAKQLLAAAGASNLELTAQFQPYLEEHKEAATLLQSDLQQIGVKLNLVPTTYPTYVKELASPTTTPDVMLIWDFAQYPDAGIMLYRTYYSALIGKGSNYGGYSDKSVDALLDQAIAQPDDTKRCALYQEIQKTVAADHVSMNIADPKMGFVIRRGITGVETTPTHQAINLMAIRVS